MRKILAAVILSIVMLVNMTVAFAAESTGKSIIVAQPEIGTFKAAYDSENGKKLKLMVEKDGQKIYYSLRNDGTSESFPLQMGNGDYRISIMENIAGSKYRYISTENITMALEDQNGVFLASIQNISWNENMAAIKKAKELTKGLTKDREKVKAIYEYIIKNIRYDHEKLQNLTSDYLPNIDTVFQTNKGICYDSASIFAAMLRSVGIPAKLVKGYSKATDGYHAWNEIYNSDTGCWEIIDTTYDAQARASNDKYEMVKKNNSYSKVCEY